MRLLPSDRLFSSGLEFAVFAGSHQYGNRCPMRNCGVRQVTFQLCLRKRAYLLWTTFQTSVNGISVSQPAYVSEKFRVIPEQYGKWCRLVKLLSIVMCVGGIHYNGQVIELINQWWCCCWSPFRSYSLFPHSPSSWLGVLTQNCYD